MRLIIRISFVAVLFFAALSAAVFAQTASPPLPNPVLYMTGFEEYKAGGKDYIRYNYAVFNSTSYPNTLFDPAPALPPCGANTKSSRTWVDIYDQRGKRIYGFCAFGKSDNLNSIWFGLPIDELPPSWIYIEMTDRQTGTKYKSNLAETTM
jgi:opacity protein-like surface antigen